MFCKKFAKKSQKNRKKIAKNLQKICENFAKKSCDKFAKFLRRHILQKVLHFRPREESVRDLVNLSSMTL